MTGSLLSRLESAADPHSVERQSYKQTDLESSVIAHLADMLNTRQGSSLTCPDYGVLDMNDVLHDFPDGVGLLQRAIKHSIATYEPRLKNVQGRPIKNEQTQSLVLEFEITAQLELPDGRRQPLRLATSVDEHGHVKFT